MKNLNLNTDLFKKMKNNNFKIIKNGIALGLVATSIISFSGCKNNKNYVLENTTFANTVVGYVSNDIGSEVRFLRISDSRSRYDLFNDHTDYRDIINGEYITDSSDCPLTYTGSYMRVLRTVTKVDSIDICGTLFQFLTEEELELVLNGKEDEINVPNILIRIREELKEKKLTK